MAVRNLIRCLEIENLKNPDVVANLVRVFGIMPWVHPGMELSGPEVQFINPDGMASIGQTPDQIAKALVYLSGFKIDSFCEIGICYGGNFLFTSEYLRRFNSDIQCTGIDPTNYLDADIRGIVNATAWMEFISATSDAVAGRKFDFVFLDGEHSTAWLVKDYENVGKYAKFCGFHDLQDSLWPDVAAFWATLESAKKEKVEFLDDPSGRKTHGIGIIHDKEKREKA